MDALRLWKLEGVIRLTLCRSRDGAPVDEGRSRCGVGVRLVGSVGGCSLFLKKAPQAGDLVSSGINSCAQYSQNREP